MNLKLWRKYAIREFGNSGVHKVPILQTPTPGPGTQGRVRNVLLGPTAEWKVDTDGSPVSCHGRGIGRKEIQRLAAALGGPLPN